MFYIGIDTGKDGGIAVLTYDGKIKLCQVMPTIKGTKTEYDVAAVVDILRCFSGRDDCFAVVERTQVTPVAGKMACFGLGYGLALIEGIFAALGIPYMVVRAQEWQKTIHAGLPGENTKQRSILYCKRRFPGVDLRRTPGCSTDHDGMADALCIAAYARMKENKEETLTNIPERTKPSEEPEPIPQQEQAGTLPQSPRGTQSRLG
jgi:hypothetical protein